MTGNRREFDRLLEGIEAKVIELFALVAEDLPAATHAVGHLDLRGAIHVGHSTGQGR